MRGTVRRIGGGLDLVAHLPGRCRPEPPRPDHPRRRHLAELRGPPRAEGKQYPRAVRERLRLSQRRQGPPWTADPVLPVRLHPFRRDARFPSRKGHLFHTVPPSPFPLLPHRVYRRLQGFPLGGGGEHNQSAEPVFRRSRHLPAFERGRSDGPKPSCGHSGCCRPGFGPGYWDGIHSRQRRPRDGSRRPPAHPGLNRRT